MEALALIKAVLAVKLEGLGTAATLKVALVWPAKIVTLEGTVAAAELPLESETVRSVPKGKLMLTVPVDAEEPASSLTAVGLRLSVKAGTVKLPVLTPVPLPVVTEIAPVMAALGTVAVIWVSLTTVKEEAATPAKLTPVAPEKPVPVMVTIVPAGPETGLKLLIVGPPLPAAGVTLAHVVPTRIVLIFNEAARLVAPCLNPIAWIGFAISFVAEL